MIFPLVTAHTGCMGTEANSIASVEEGIRRGADIIEVDVRATKDGIPLLAHDEVFETASGRILTIGEVRYAELLENGIRPVLLTDAMELIRDGGRTANLDLKTGSTLDAMIRTIRDMKLEDGVIITGCGKEMVMEITSRYRGFRALMDVDVEPLLAGGYEYSALVRQWCADAVEACSCAFNIPYQICTEELVVRAARRCLPVSLYTVDDREQMKKCTEMGAFSITTNRVDWLMELKGQMAAKD